MSGEAPSSLEQLRRALEAGHIDQATCDAAAAGVSARLAGAGAIAQGPGATAVGAGGVAVAGHNSGLINLGVLIQQAAHPGASAQELRSAYLARMLLQADQLPLFAGDSAKAPIRLSSVYTALLTQRSESEPGSRGARRRDASPELGAQEHLSALDVLNAERRLVLLGGPGSGKSTFVNFVALAMAGEMLGVPAPNLATLTAPLPSEDGKKEKPKPQLWDHGALLPVCVVLRDLASQLPPPGRPVDAAVVWDFIVGQLKTAALADFAPVLKEELLKGALVLFDGLDEVPDASDRRVQIKRAVQAFAATFSNCRLLVTSRTYAYQRQDWKLQGFTEVALLPFTPPQIRCFVDAWYAHTVELLRLTEASARDRAGVLKREVERYERLRELAERPLLLTLIARCRPKAAAACPTSARSCTTRRSRCCSTSGRA